VNVGSKIGALGPITGKMIIKPKTKQMTLSFSTTWPKRMGGGPTNFVEKTWAGIEEGLDQSEILFYSDNGKRFDPYSNHAPKLHTFREDPHDRWKVGMKIHPVINNRTPQRFQFAPILECKGVQRIDIFHNVGHTQIDIDGECYGEVFHHGLDCIYEYTNDLQDLAINDGFDSIEQFFQWFDKDFKGVIVHWTPIRY